MTVDELERELAAGVLRPAYLLAGEELWLLDTALQRLRAAALAGAPEAFNLTRFEAEKTSPAQLRMRCAPPPIAAPQRLVWLRLADSIRGRVGALLEDLPAVLPELAERGGAILAVTTARVDRRTSWVAAFREPAARVDCAPLRDRRALLGFLQGQARARDLQLEAAAARHLVERTGPHLQLLCNELEKAALLVLPERRIREAHVRSATADLAEKPVWDLTDALGEGRVGDALTVLVKLGHGAAPPPLVLGALASHFRKLLRVQSGAAVKGPPFALGKLKKQAARYRPGELRAALAAIRDADLAVKGAAGTGVGGPAGVGAATALEQLVLRLAPTERS